MSHNYVDQKTSEKYVVRESSTIKLGETVIAQSQGICFLCGLVKVVLPTNRLDVSENSLMCLERIRSSSKYLPLGFTLVICTTISSVQVVTWHVGNLCSKPVQGDTQ